MKILLVITSLRTGGAEKLMTQLLPRLRDAGIDAEIAVFDGIATKFLGALRRAGITVYRLGEPNSFVYNPMLISKLRQLMSRYDIVHTHNTSPQFFAAVAAKFMRRKPILVTTEHNTDNRRRNNRLGRAADRWMYSRYDLVIAITKEVESCLLDHLNGSSINTTVICNGIDTKQFMSPIKQLTPDGPRTIVMVGAFREQKDQDTLIRAMCHLPERFRLRLVGGDARLGNCIELAANLGLADRVTFDGLRTDIPAVLEQADYVCMSTHYEGLSLAVVEGMCSGRPLIASDVRGVKDLVSGAGILFPEGNDHALAEAIMRLDSDPELYHTTALAGRERGLQYDISNMVDGYINAYNSLMSKG